MAIDINRTAMVRVFGFLAIEETEVVEVDRGDVAQERFFDGDGWMDGLCLGGLDWIGSGSDALGM